VPKHRPQPNLVAARRECENEGMLHSTYWSTERHRLESGAPELSAWQRFCPDDVRLDPLLLRIEQVLDDPEVEALLEDCERDCRYPSEVRARLHDAGLARLFSDSAGSGVASTTAWHLGALNALTSRRNASLAITVGVNALALLPAWIAATPDQLRRIAKRVDDGAFSALLLSELPHGSNLVRNEARAERGTLDQTGAFVPARDACSHYRVRGEKHLINGGHHHELLFALLRTRDPAPRDPAVRAMTDFSMFWVERGETTSSLPRWTTAPARAADISGVAFDDTLVPVEQRLGAEGQGFSIVRRTLTLSRGGIAALASGIASRARDVALTYARRRDIHGAPILTLGAISAHLMRIEALARAAAASSLRTAAYSNALGLGAAYYTAVGKLTACDLAEETVREGSRVLGARALLCDLQWERLVRDVQLYGVFDGTRHVVLDEVSARLAQQVDRYSGEKRVRDRDLLAEARRVYATPPTSLVDVLARPSPLLVLPAPDYLRALVDLPGAIRLDALPLVGAALYDLVGALRARGGWQADQELRFQCAEVAGLVEAIIALVELTDPDRRSDLGLAPAAILPHELESDRLVYRFAVGWLAARAVRRTRELAGCAGLRDWLSPAVLQCGGLDGLELALLAGLKQVRVGFGGELRHLVQTDVDAR
jgi:alkylation response protein AidB-like acyl-CoA dehydrogenase